MKIGLTEILLVGGGLWLWSKSQEGKAPETQGIAIPDDAKPAVAAALDDLARRYPGQIFRLIKIERREWSDSSMGVPVPGQIYAQVLTPGYHMEFTSGAILASYNGNLSGRVVLTGAAGIAGPN